KLGQVEQAIEQLRQILEVQPDDTEAADVLEGIYRDSGQSRELRSLLLHRVDHAADDAERKHHLSSLAQLEEDVLDDPESAAARYRQILDRDASDAAALAALDRLSVASQRWDDVVDVIRRRREVAET